MCGICGVVNFERGEPVDPGMLAAMNSTLIHRGPDDEGYYLDGPVGLGSRRLSIIDLEGGRQPIHNEDETVWIVFNGEIYNFRELRLLLEKLGHHFYTCSDTEAIVHAYEEFGGECVDYLNGMFAFALWDKPRQRLFIARDRLGIKPLYYTQLQGMLVFGSELKAVVAHPTVERRVDLVALNEYLSFEYVPTPRTIFQGIRKLSPGHTLTLERGQMRVKRYWDIQLGRSETSQPRGKADYVAELRETLREAVRQELVSDVPIGVLLSGGLDSSAVAAMMAELMPGNVKSFSIAFDDPSFDESKYAKLVARHLGTEHYQLTLTAGITLDLLSDIAQFLDEPLGDSSVIPTYLLSQFTRQHVKVALGGDGGDELFAGYSTLQAHRLVEYYERIVPGVVRYRLVPWVVDRLPVSHDNISFDFKARRFISGRGVPIEERHHRWMGSFTPAQKRELLQPWLAAAVKDTYRVAFEHSRACEAEEWVNRVLYLDMKLYLEGGMLPKVDRASMANSLEVRVPLLNHTLVEYMAGLPHELKLHRMTTKYLLRLALRGLVPDAILRRGKKGFNMPVAKWLAGPLRSLAEDMFSQERLKREGFFNPTYVRQLLDEHLAGQRDHRKLLWTLLMFELWHMRWSSGATPPTSVEGVKSASSTPPGAASNQDI